jgi:hypothetical protein
MSSSANRRNFFAAGLLCALALAAVTAVPARGSASATALDPQALAGAKAIRTQLNARYRRAPGRKLVVSEATTTAAVESFTLLGAGLAEPRTVPAADGIWYAICPKGARCPYPGRRFARPAGDYLPRRLALELAVRTFMETSASVVAVSLPTPGFTLLVVERAELTDLPGLARVLRGTPATAQLRVVDLLTRPRVFIGVSLEPTPTGGTTFTAFPRWPDAGP